MADLIHSCMTKAVIGDGDQLECGPKWITARRSTLKLYDDHLECGDWSISFVDIQDAILSKFNSPILRIPGYILAVRTDSNTYHFGLNGWRFWQGELPLPVKRQNTKLRLSPISIVSRIAAVGAIGYLIWQKIW